MKDTDGSTDDHLGATQRYYDEFAKRYDDARGGRVPGGYHDLIDELELAFLQRHGTGKRILEVGCGTGLLLARMERFASSAEGVDLSPGMLDKARARGLTVREASATSLPYEDDSFDVSCSFKVLAHVEQIRGALSEMVRVVRPGGVAVAEFYNPWSLRALVKRFGPAGAISARTNEDAVHTRFDSPKAVEALMPPATEIVDARGVRIVTPAARLLRWPVVGPLLTEAERRLCDGPLARFGGFWIAAIRKPGGGR
ncbi:MAG: methyltransferase domain-containing protein [Deltaproteobacteria bacterium]|nr:methyltransferase domain-containing protein [Deltaproteobacteria bacterium]